MSDVYIKCAHCGINILSRAGSYAPKGLICDVCKDEKNKRNVLHLVRYVNTEQEPIHEDHEDYRFWCPGCDKLHHIRAKGPTPVWTFNGSLEFPTFSPSHLTGSKNFTVRRCHSYIKGGTIQFLGDCHHELKGKTVPLPFTTEWKYGN